MVEALAIREAITFALNRGFESLILLSDSQSLIKMIKNNAVILELFGVLHNIYLLSQNFNFIDYKFIPRAANDKTDSVAKQALYALNHF